MVTLFIKPPPHASHLLGLETGLVRSRRFKGNGEQKPLREDPLVFLFASEGTVAQ